MVNQGKTGDPALYEFLLSEYTCQSKPALVRLNRIK